MPVRILLVTVFTAAFMLTVRLFFFFVRGCPAPATKSRPPLVEAEKPADGESAKATKAKNSSRAEPDEGYSDAEIAALQSLAQRREELDGREKALDTREGLLPA